MKKEAVVLVVILAVVIALIFYKSAFTGRITGDEQVPVCPDGWTFDGYRGEQDFFQSCKILD